MPKSGIKKEKEMKTISNQKYEITDMAHEEYPFLHRIRALRDICGEIRSAHRRFRGKRKQPVRGAGRLRMDTR